MQYKYTKEETYALINDNNFEELKDVIKNHHTILSHYDLMRFIVTFNIIDALDFFLNNDILIQDLNYNSLLEIAVQYNHPLILQSLLKNEHFDPTKDISKAFSLSCELGHLECVTLFIDDGRVNLTIFNNDSIYVADEGGFDSIVQLLGSQKTVRELLILDKTNLGKKLYKKLLIKKITEF